MNSNHVINIIDRYFNTLEYVGNINNIEFNYVLQMMFLDEYYEYHRDLKDLTDCMVKAINSRIDCFKYHSCLFKGQNFDEVETLNHWIIPPGPENNPYFEDNILNILGNITNNILQITGSLLNNILEL